MFEGILTIAYRGPLVKAFSILWALGHTLISYFFVNKYEIIFAHVPKPFWLGASYLELYTFGHHVADLKAFVEIILHPIILRIVNQLYNVTDFHL